MYYMVKDIFARLINRAIDAITAKEELALNRKNIIAANYAANISANFFGGNFFTGLLLLLQADNAFLGIIAMVGSLANMFQVLSPLLLERFERRKKLLITGRCINHIINIFFISIITLLPVQNTSKLLFILAVNTFLTLMNTILSPGFAVWHIRSIPESIRADYFSFFTISNVILNTSAVMAGSWLVDYFKSGGEELKGLLLLRAIAIITAAIDIYCLTKIKEYPVAKPDKRVNLVSVLIDPLRERQYMKTVMISFLWYFTSSIPGPYFNVYILKDLQISYTYINFVGMIGIPVLLLFNPIWAKIIQKLSWVNTLGVAVGMYVLHYLGMVMVTSHTMFLYPVFAVYGSIVSSGISLVLSNMPFINIPEKNQANYIGFFTTMNSIAAMLGVAVGREFIKLTDNLQFKMLGIDIYNKQYLMFIAACFAAATAVLIGFMQKRSIFMKKNVSA